MKSTWVKSSAFFLHHDWIHLQPHLVMWNNKLNFPAMSHTNTMLVVKSFSNSFSTYKALLQYACTHTQQQRCMWRRIYLWFQTTQEHQRILWRRRPPCAPQGHFPLQKRWRGTPQRAGELHRPAIVVWESTRYANDKWRISEDVHCRRL